jgi:hypothetical protein
VGGLLWPVGGDVARFAGVFAEVEDLAARADDEFAVRFVVGREAGGQGASVADTTGRVMITPTILRHPGSTPWPQDISGLGVRSRLFCHLAFSSRLWFPR